MSEAAIEQLAIAFDLFDAAESIQRQNLRRRLPDASEEEIERHLEAWLSDRRGAEHGDTVGVVRSWPPARFS